MNMTGEIDRPVDAGWEIDGIGLEVTERITLEQWMSIWKRLTVIHKGINWAIGDLLIYADTRRDWGQDYTQGLSHLGIDPDTMANMKWVSSRFPRELRRAKLSFTHHQEVAGMNPVDREDWLDLCEQEGWSSGRLRKRIHDARVLAGTNRPSAKSSQESDPRIDAVESIKSLYLALDDLQRREFRSWVDMTTPRQG
jgi:hypothetical protein